jgi:hypothetical protein
MYVIHANKRWKEYEYLVAFESTRAKRFPSDGKFGHHILLRTAQPGAAVLDGQAKQSSVDEDVGVEIATIEPAFAPNVFISLGVI